MIIYREENDELPTQKLLSRRKILISFLLVLCLAVGGCRLFRFLEVKGQLEDFSENFGVSDHDGLRLAFKNPVLLTEDIEWLMVYSPPVKTRLAADTDFWTYHLVKKYPGRKSENGNFDLTIGIKLCREKVCEVVFPERFTKHINKNIFGKVMNSVGDAELKKLEKTSTAAVRSLKPSEIPNSSQVTEILGYPYAKLNEDGVVFVYKYRLREKTPEGKYIMFRLLVSFDERTDKVKKLVLPLRSVKLAVNFEPDVARR